MNDNVDDYRWLVDAAAERWLERATGESSNLVKLAQSLRKDLSPARTHLVLEQVELRRRAAEKFSRADRLFFTRQTLEQATDERIAAYKAERFRGSRAAADLCCGIGGDLMSLAAQAPCHGVELNPCVAILAAANCRVALGREVRVVVDDVRQFSPSASAAWHLDPDRRPGGRRTTELELYEPPLAWIESTRQAAGDLALKLAPATRTPEEWRDQAELCWIGSRRECRQQMAWFGQLARHPGRRSAVVFVGRGETPVVVVGDPGERAASADGVARYVYEPDSTLLAAGLADSQAEASSLSRICDDAAYFTSDQLRRLPLFDVFETLETLPFDRRRLNAALAARGVGRLEIKKRHLDVTPEQLRKGLRLSGDNQATLLLVPTRPAATAVLARRLERSDVAESIDAAD